MFLQAQPIPSELTAAVLGNCVAVSPIVTIEPRRRKFHKPITLTLPVPQAANKGMINQYSGDAPTLRLLCSITGWYLIEPWTDSKVFFDLLIFKYDFFLRRRYVTCSMGRCYRINAVDVCQRMRLVHDNRFGSILVNGYSRYSGSYEKSNRVVSRSYSYSFYGQVSNSVEKEWSSKNSC